MNHPPIPPHCPYFCTEDDRPGMLWFHCENFKISNYEVACCLTIHTDELQVIRPVVAAVARCAWLDYARIIRTLGQADFTKDAALHAEAWRLWGEQ